MKHLITLPILLLAACAKHPAPTQPPAPVEHVYPQPAPVPVLLTNQPVKNLFFAHDVDTLLPGQIRLMPYLNRWAEYNGVTIVVTGYADTMGSAEYNDSLSMRRAKAAAEHIPGSIVRWRGETDEFGDDKRNRRVTFEPDTTKK